MDENTDKISIALCTYNGERYIAEQLESLINQTRQPDEIIICDDQSKDNTVIVAKRVLNSWQGKWKIIVNDKNLGYKKNFQKAISLCSGEFIFLSDQDDVWDKRKLEIILDAFHNHPDAIMVFHDAELVNENLQSIYPSLWATMGFDYRQFRNNVYGRFMKGNVVQGAACAFKRKLFDIAQPFPADAIHYEWLALNAIPNGGIYPVNEKLLKYRQTGHNEIGAVSENVLGKIRKWSKNIHERIKFHREELLRYAAVWNVLNEKYGHQLVLGSEDATTFSEFLNCRREAIAMKKIGDLPTIRSYFPVYNNWKVAFWTKLKDILTIILT